MESWAILASIAVLVLIYVYRLYQKKADYFKNNGVPAIKAIPFFGNMAPCILGVRSFGDLIRDVYISAPPDARYVGFMDFTKPTVIIRDLELYNEISVKNFDHFVNRQPFGDIELDPLFNNFLLSMTDERWHAMRTTLTPTFTTAKIKFMFHLIKDCADDFAKAMESKCQRSPICVNTKDMFSKVTNDIIVTTAFGVSVNSTKDPDNDFYSKGYIFTETGYFRLMKFFLARTPLGTAFARLLKLRIVPERVQMFFRNVVASNIDQRRTQGVVRSDMIHLLMGAKIGAEKRDLTIDEIAAQALIFYFGGFDTVSTALCSVLYLLAEHPEVQEKLQDTIDRVYEETGGNVSYEDLQQLPYMDAVIHEATRLLPPFSQTDRVCTKRYELPPALPGLKPLIIEPGTVVHMSMLSIQRDAKYFPKPDEFIPERFLDENGQMKKLPGYLSFGRGPRNCIGNRFALVEMKIILVRLLAKISFKLCDKTIPPTRFSQATNQYNPVDPIVLLMELREGTKDHQ